MFGSKKKTRSRRRDRDVFNDLEDKVIQIESIRKKYISRIERQVHQHFVANDGCQTCRGRGWTVDPATEAFLTCDNAECTPASRQRSGLDVGFDRHDRSQGLRNPCGKSNPMYSIMVSPLDTMICSLLSQVLDERSRLDDLNSKKELTNVKKI